MRAARACAHLIWKYQLLPSADLIALVFARRDNIVLATQAVHMCSRLPLAEQRAHYHQAARSHVGPVRVLALRAILARPDCDRVGGATSALTDMQGAVRALAIRFLTASGVDVRAYYRTRLTQGALTAKCTCLCLGALAGLGARDDLALIQSFLASASVCVPVTAYAGWLKLAANEKDTLARLAFLDAAPGVRKFALKAALPLRWRISGHAYSSATMSPCRCSSWSASAGPGWNASRRLS